MKVRLTTDKDFHSTLLLTFKEGSGNTRGTNTQAQQTFSQQNSTLLAALAAGKHGEFR